LGTLFLVLVFVALPVQIAFWILALSLWRRVPTETSSDSGDTAVSVIVAARNEEKRLPKLLDALRRQSHALFEVIVVDDGSTDSTSAVAERISAIDARIRVLRLDGPVAKGKRGALAAGINVAQHDVLAMTDADCRPAPGWLASLVRFHHSHPDSVLVGYGPMVFRHGLLNRLVRFETLMSAVLTRMGIRLGIPFMAVGRNLSYPRSVFMVAGGFGNSGGVKSGDDDLFVQRVVRVGAGAVHYLDVPESFVRSEAPSSWSHWVRQKRRHHSAGRLYRPLPQLFLSGFHVSSVVLWLAPILLGPPGLLFLGAKLAVHSFSLAHIARRMEEQGLAAHTPYLDILYVLYVALVGTSGLLLPPRRW
jgi:glycosyltransferase involved in cell wall biosynthesis